MTDVLKDNSPFDIMVGAQSQRIPLVLILDLSCILTEEISDDFEDSLVVFLDWIYKFEFSQYSLHGIQPRLSLSVFSTGANGCVLLPPRLLKERPPSECGRHYFTNCSWSTEEALKELLLPLPRGPELGMAGICAAIGRMFHSQDNNVPALYTINKGDAKCITIIMTTRDIDECKYIYDSLLKIDDYKKILDSICLWRFNDKGSEHFFSKDENIHVFGNGLFQWLKGRFVSLSNEIVRVYSDPTIDHAIFNIFPDAVMPSHKGPVPGIIFSEASPNACTYVAMQSVLDGDERYLEAQLELSFPRSEEINETDVEVKLKTPSDILKDISYSLRQDDSVHVADDKIYVLRICCKPNDWDGVYTGLSFRIGISITGGLTYLADIFGSVWIPPTTWTQLISSQPTLPPGQRNPLIFKSPLISKLARKLTRLKKNGLHKISKVNLILMSVCACLLITQIISLGYFLSPNSHSLHEPQIEQPNKGDTTVMEEGKKVPVASGVKMEEIELPEIKPDENKTSSDGNQGDDETLDQKYQALEAKYREYVEGEKGRLSKVRAVAVQEFKDKELGGILENERRAAVGKMQEEYQALEQRYKELVEGEKGRLARVRTVAVQEFKDKELGGILENERRAAVGKMQEEYQALEQRYKELLEENKKLSNKVVNPTSTRSSVESKIQKLQEYVKTHNKGNGDDRGLVNHMVEELQATDDVNAKEVLYDVYRAYLYGKGGFSLWPYFYQECGLNKK